jgi:hypothetical protein
MGDKKIPRQRRAASTEFLLHLRAHVLKRIAFCDCSIDCNFSNFFVC